MPLPEPPTRVVHGNDLHPTAATKWGVPADATKWSPDSEKAPFLEALSGNRWMLPG